ncbi:MAG: hypothetical protein M3R15_27640, partial [Acidobacteriota bacterium]|nr:hypothetical protein [Acidobacteriota bacterium]
VRISGARVALLTDQAGSALGLRPNTSFPPNEANDNPFLTDAQGRFSFALAPDQLGASTAPIRYFLSVTAPGYRGRMLEVTLLPTGNGVFEATVRALDDQSIARLGSFKLTSETVLIQNIASLALNIPLFETTPLEVTKSADKQNAEIGDVISYRISLRNATASVISDVAVRDQLPPSFHYAAGTARIEGGATPMQAVEPELAADGTLLFKVGNLDAGANITILYRVRVGANARDGEQFNSAIASGLYLSGERATTSPARVAVRVSRGVFSMRQVIIGRVFEDTNNNGQFDNGERPVAGVRLYLNNGQSVITDSAGQYNIPSVGEGSLVISLDPVTVPAGYALADDRRRSGRSWTRLLRTPLGGGALLRQNFALLPSNPTDNAANVASSSAVTSSTAIPVSGTVSPAPAATPAQALVKIDAASLNANARLLPAPKQPLTAGTYETVATDIIAPVAIGDVMILSPVAEKVVMTPALAVEARVAETWTVALEVNGERIDETSIGERRLDHKNKVASFVFVGVNLRPGSNHIKVTAMSPEGVSGKTIERVVFGRGPTKRLEISTAKRELQAGGRDSTMVTVRAFDAWGHPAADGQIALQTSAGRLLVRATDANSKSNSEINSALVVGIGAANLNATNIASPEQTGANTQSQVIQSTGGEATVELFSDGAATTADLLASAGETEARGQVRIIPELRTGLLVGLAEISIGNAAPEISQSGDEGNVRNHLAFFYRGAIGSRNLLTLAYDSQRPLNRTAGRDRLFTLDPLDRAYPLFGDSSTRFEDAQSNSKLYVRLDRGRSYAMFGDFDADLTDAGLAGYARKLTGVKLHVENGNGDFVTVTGARPDTAFARDVLPGGFLSLVRLSHTDIFPGSETVMLEVRDRRNPEIIIKSETLIRSVDYNLNSTNGEIFFLRPISTFDYNFNLLQTV